MTNLNNLEETTTPTASAEFVYLNLLDDIVSNVPVFQQWYKALQKYDLVGTESSDKDMSGPRNAIMWMIAQGKQNSIDASASSEDFYKAFINEYAISGTDENTLEYIKGIKQVLDKGGIVPLGSMLGPVSTDLPGRYESLDMYLDEYGIPLASFIKQNSALLPKTAI